MSSGERDRNEFAGDLREMIGRDRVVAVVGSGVSKATNSGAPMWRELVQSAILRYGECGVGEAWCRMVQGLLDLENASDMLLAAAELVESKLREIGELGRWLRDTLGSLQPDNPRAIREAPDVSR